MAQPVNDTPLVQFSKDKIMLQSFSWGSSRENWFQKLATQSPNIALSGIDLVWLPPFHQSLAPQGYMPIDYFNFNSSYGNIHDLQNAIKSLHDNKLTVLADIVVNHRCANQQDKNGKWNVFKCSRGIMDWDASCLIKSEEYGGTGHEKAEGLGPFDAAPNIDHLHPKVQKDIVTYLKFLRSDMQIDGFRLDFTKGYQAEIAGMYMKESNPVFAVGEFWDALDYDGNRPKTNQNDHRARLQSWVEKTNMQATAFDFTTKGVLQEALRWSKYQLLIDEHNRPQGLIGKLPGYAVTFVDNHDTGSEQGHWPFSNENIEMGYAYLLTHPGVPCIFWDHLFDWKYSESIRKLIFYRRDNKINSLSKVEVKQADTDRYVAIVDDKICLVLGSQKLDPDSPKDDPKYIFDESVLLLNDQDEYNTLMKTELWALYKRK